MIIGEIKNSKLIITYVSDHGDISLEIPDQ